MIPRPGVVVTDGGLHGREGGLHVSVQPLRDGLLAGRPLAEVAAILALRVLCRTHDAVHERLCFLDCVCIRRAWPRGAGPPCRARLRSDRVQKVELRVSTRLEDAFYECVNVFQLLLVGSCG